MSINNMDKEIWEGWTVKDFIESLQPEIEMIMKNQSWKKPFKNIKELTEYCISNQPYYKKRVPEVIRYFAQKYNIK